MTAAVPERAKGIGSAFAYALTTRYEFEGASPLERDIPFDFGIHTGLAWRP